MDNPLNNLTLVLGNTFSILNARAERVKYFLNEYVNINNGR